MGVAKNRRPVQITIITGNTFLYCNLIKVEKEKPRPQALPSSSFWSVTKERAETWECLTQDWHLCLTTDTQRWGRIQVSSSCPSTRIPNTYKAENHCSLKNTCMKYVFFPSGICTSCVYIHITHVYRCSPAFIWPLFVSWRPFLGWLSGLTTVQFLITYKTNTQCIATYSEQPT